MQYFNLKCQFDDLSSTCVAYDYPIYKRVSSRTKANLWSIDQILNDNIHWTGLISQDIPGLISGDHFTYLPIYLKFKTPYGHILIVSQSQYKLNNIPTSLEGNFLHCTLNITTRGKWFDIKSIKGLELFADNTTAIYYELNNKYPYLLLIVKDNTDIDINNRIGDYYLYSRMIKLHNILQKINLLPLFIIATEYVNNDN